MIERRNRGPQSNLRNRLLNVNAAFGSSSKRSGAAAQIIILVVLVVLFSIGTKGKYLSTANIQVILSLAAIPAILAMGLHQAVILGGIDLSVEGVVAIVVVFVGILAENKFNSNDVGLWIIPISVGIGAIAGALSGILNTRLRIPSFISTLGLSWILYGLAVYINKAVNIPLLDDRIQTFLNGNLFGIPHVAVLAIFIVAVVQIFQNRTQIARYMYAIGGDEVLARQAGVKVESVKIIIFTLGGLLYGLGGLLLACRMGSATSRTGVGLLFPTITAVAVGGVALTGGIGGARNAALGALIVTALNNGLILMKVNPYAQQAVNGLVLIIAVALTLDRKKLGFIK